jgi:hypothetical protein
MQLVQLSPSLRHGRITTDEQRSIWRPAASTHSNYQIDASTTSAPSPDPHPSLIDAMDSRDREAAKGTK